MLWHCEKFCHNNTMNLSRCSFSKNFVSANDLGGVVVHYQWGLNLIPETCQITIT